MDILLRVFGSGFNSRKHMLILYVLKICSILYYDTSATLDQEVDLNTDILFHY